MAYIFLQLIALAFQINGIISKRPNIPEICNLLMVYVFAIQSITKGISRLVKDDEKSSKEISVIIDNFLMENEKNEKFREILTSHVKVLKKVVVIYLVVSCVVYHLPVATGWMLTWITGKVQFFTIIKFPWIDVNTTFGYLLAQLFMTIISTAFFLIIATGDIHNVYMTLQTWSMVEVYNCKVDQFGVSLKNFIKMEAKIQEKIEKLGKKFGHKSSKTFNISRQSDYSELLELQDKLKNMNKDVDKQFIYLINEHQAYNSYVSRILTYREMITFVSLYVNFIGIGLSLVVVRFSSISFGIAACTIFTLQVFVHCFECTLVAIQNEKLLTKIQDFPWYELSNSQKKIYLQFLCVCQNTNSFSLPIFGDVNMELFTDIMQAAYSFLMYVIQFVK